MSEVNQNGKNGYFLKDLLCAFCLRVWMFTCVSGGHLGEMMVSGALKLELQRVVSLRVGADN